MKKLPEQFDLVVQATALDNKVSKVVRPIKQALHDSDVKSVLQFGESDKEASNSPFISSGNLVDIVTIDQIILIERILF
jgi:hypothetical protein